MIPIPSLPEKNYFSMREVTTLAQIPAYTLRYWEQQIGSLRPTRLASGHRRYTRADVETIFKIKNLLWQQKLTVSGVKQALKRPGGREKISAPKETGTLNAETLDLLRQVKKEIKILSQELS